MTRSDDIWPGSPQPTERVFDPDSVAAAAASLLRLRDKVSASRSADLAALVVITARGAAYRRPDGVCVTPITSLGP